MEKEIKGKYYPNWNNYNDENPTSNFDLRINVEGFCDLGKLDFELNVPLSKEQALHLKKQLEIYLKKKFEKLNTKNNSN